MATQARRTITVPEVRALAVAWSRRLEEIAADMYEYLAERIPEARADDPELAGLTLASCRSNVEAILSMIRHGIPSSATEAPVAALEHARVMAQRGLGIDATLRFYRLGQGHFLESWYATLALEIDDREQLARALSETAAFVVDYIDAISTRVSAEHLAERERRQRRAAVVRADVVRAVLSGEHVDVTAAERALGHPLRRPQLAFVCWTAQDPGELERAGTALAQELGSDRPLLVPDGPEALGGWVVPRPGAQLDLDRMRAVLADAAPGVLAAFGEPGSGLEGFRASREQADRARRVTGIAGLRPPAAVRHRDVALVDLLSRDLDGVREFVRSELAGLAADEPGVARLREALLAVVAPQGGFGAAARTLGLLGNTILQRIRRAEELRGRTATDRPGELYAALLLAASLGAAVLTPD